MQVTFQDMLSADDNLSGYPGGDLYPFKFGRREGAESAPPLVANNAQLDLRYWDAGQQSGTPAHGQPILCPDSGRIEMRDRCGSGSTVNNFQFRSWRRRSQLLQQPGKNGRAARVNLGQAAQ